MALQSEMNARQDAFEYRAQAQRERQKAKTMINTLVMLQEYNKFKKDKLKEDPDWEERAPYDGGPSRMEPMRFYSEDDIKKQKVEAIERARKFEDLANKYEQIAKDKKRLQAEIQKKLKNPSRTSVFYPMKER